MPQRPYYYAGDSCHVVALIPEADGVRLMVIDMRHSGGANAEPVVNIVLNWQAFGVLAKDSTGICALAARDNAACIASARSEVHA